MTRGGISKDIAALMSKPEFVQRAQKRALAEKVLDAAQTAKALENISIDRLGAKDGGSRQQFFTVLHGWKLPKWISAINVARGEKIGACLIDATAQTTKGDVHIKTSRTGTSSDRKTLRSQKIALVVLQAGDDTSKARAEILAEVNAIYTKL